MGGGSFPVLVITIQSIAFPEGCTGHRSPTRDTALELKVKVK